MAVKTVDPIVGTGGWVKFLRHNGNPDLIARTHVAKVETNRHNELTLTLYSRAGAAISTSGSYWVVNDGTYVEACDDPEFKPLLADIPNTAEVQAAKDEIWRHFTRYARSHGYDSMVKQALAELGIDKPNAGKIEATVSFTVNVDVDKMNPDTDITNFEQWFNAMNTAERLLALARQAKAAGVSINYELKPTATTGKPKSATTKA